MKQVLQRPAQWIYAVLNRHGNLVPGQVKTDMEHLYPGGNKEELCRKYYVEKIQKSLMIILCGTMLALLMAVRAIRGQPLEKENMLRRGGVLDEGKEIILEGIYGDQKKEFRVYMEPIQLDPENMDEQYRAFTEKLPALILGNNLSLQEVKADLDLTDRYEEYPFQVEWKSSNTDVISGSGKVVPAEQEEEVMLQAMITYGENEWETGLWVNVPAREYTREEYQYRKAVQLLEEAEQNSREEEYWTLPTIVDEIEIKWQNPTKNNGFLVFIGICMIAILIFFMSDRDLHQELEKQRECMKREYPDIVHKLALYLGAGMTLQGAFHKIGSEYEQQRKTGREISPGYEHVLYTCRELKSGVPESQAYERFGRRAGVQEYIRLSTLMTQNLRKGSSSLLVRLHEEAERSLMQRIQTGRKLGEEASTKLLIPMVMMLGVVMVMVMLPAFTSMGM